MTDQQLLDAGERLYKAFLGSNFTFLELAGLAAARERRTAWSELGQNLKLAVFRLVVLSEPEQSTADSSDSSLQSPTTETEQTTPPAGGSSDDVASDSDLSCTAKLTDANSTPAALHDGHDPTDGTEDGASATVNLQQPKPDDGPE